MVELTARHRMPLLVAGQGQKDITHNEALLQVDALLSPVAERADLIEPPLTPVFGQCWLLPAAPLAAWAGEAGRLAVWTEGGWRFFDLPVGTAVYVKSTGKLMRRYAGGWADEHWAGVVGASVPSPSGGSVIDGQARSAINQLTQRLVAVGLLAS
ncbi:DUF2793 domain-containing protein [Sandaracinobacter neustonicus]|uniref:DUF2793 domain-containing protein n=1 Tax=Sandaracinobacter neustonicus TaxID=1715348 RepID=A0A501XDG3_9SPHN|nr:DUF2793 domain-containing protein [Sandaracinobacter neustonicus]TPE58526.1 DUF2793 domain-containing protein [Sandaracinobacter neustonicus]